MSKEIARGKRKIHITLGIESFGKTPPRGENTSQGSFNILPRDQKKWVAILFSFPQPPPYRS